MSAWSEAAYVIDEVNKRVASLSYMPKPPKSASCNYDDETKIVTLAIGDSDATYVDTFGSDDPTDTTVERAKVGDTAQYQIWRQDGAEITEYGQGIKIANIIKTGSSTVYEDDKSDVAGTDTDFYYAIFSVSDSGRINKDEFVRTSCTNSMTIFNVYGFKQDFNNLDPSQTITYPTEILLDPDDSSVGYSFINAEYTPMGITISGTTYTSNPGDYGSFLNDVLKNKPYMVKASDRKADYALSETQYSKRSDNSTNSDFSNSSYAGGAFAWINKIYSKEIYDAKSNTRIVMYSSDVNTKTYGFKATGFINPSNDELEGVWIPMGYTDTNGKLSGGLTGIASQDTSTQKTTIEKLTSNAKFLGGPILNILRDIEYMLFKSTDIQATAGYGRCAGYNANYPSEFKNKYSIPNQVIDENKSFSGNGNNSGTIYLRTSNGSRGFAGCTDSINKAIPAKHFHSQVLGSYNVYIRDPYTILVNGRLKVSPNYTYDITGDSYVDTGIDYAVGGYPADMKLTEAGSLPYHDSTHVGSTSTGLCDYIYVDASGVRVARRLGNAIGDLTDGPASVSLAYEASYSYPAVGVATLLLPDPGYSPEA